MQVNSDTTRKPVNESRSTFRVVSVILSILLWLLPLSASAQVSASLQSSTYRLGPGDLIFISVYDEEDLSFEVQIGDSGRITYPFLGEIQITGNTTRELESLIARGLIDGEFLIRPEVTVNIIEYRPFYISGEVEEPGSYPFEPGLTLRKAVAIAGGFTERASRSRISILSAGDQSQDSEDGRVAESLDELVKPDDIISISQRLF